MPLPSLSEIERRRRRLGLSQLQLASQANISRSSLTKIELAYRELKPGERPRYVPNFEDAKRVFEVLEGEEAKSRDGIMSQRVSKIAHSPVVQVSPDDKVSIAKGLMKRFNYSQLPVLKGDVCVGTITDGAIVDAVERTRSLDKVYQSTVGTIMEEPIPVVGEDTLLASVTPLLREQKAVLVSKSGIISGIVTAFDVMI